MLKRATESLRRRVLIEEGLAKSSKKQHYENHPGKNRALQKAEKNNKTTKKKSSDRRPS